MKYKATFEIDCGVSTGVGAKRPENVKITEIVLADNHKDAYKKSMGLAKKFSDDYLSNPDDGLTTVRLLSLRDSGGDVSFDTSKSVVKRTMWEHLLSFTSEKCA